jgi:hypothetical protein
MLEEGGKVGRRYAGNRAEEAVLEADEQSGKYPPSDMP